MSSTVIRDFLVALTFKTDDTGAKKSKEALDSNEKSAKILSQTLISLASIAVIAVAKTANELEKLFYSSQRIGASANNIRAYGDAISQMGGSAEGAISSLESVARKLRESPGYEGMLKGLGVTTRDQNGQMRDRVEVMKDLSKTLQGMEYYKANNYANALGIDESTLMAMRDGKFTSEMEKYQKLRKDMGLNDELAKSGQEFAYQWRDMTMQLKALMEVIVMTAGKALIPVLKLLNQLIQFVIHWFGQLNPHIKTFLAAGLKIAMLTVVFGGLFSAIGKFAKLLPMLTGLLNIFKALRLVFLASPIGIVLALAAAIALLWDDYQTWKRGGESLIDWEKWAGGIETAISKIKELGNTLKDLQQKATDFILGKKIGDETLGIKLGRTVAKGLAFIGNKEAQAALDAEQGSTKQQSTQTLQQTALAGVNAIVGMANAVAGDVQEKVHSNNGHTLVLSEQDVEDLIKVTDTEVIKSLKDKDFEQQTAAVVDTILNRVMSGKWGNSVRDVANANRQFTKITGPKSYKTKSGQVINNNPYGAVQNMPASAVSPKTRAYVEKYLAQRENGTQSLVDTHLNYANPYASDAKNRREWVDEFYEKSKKDGLIFGSGKAVHGHGTTKDLEKFRPKPFGIKLNKSSTNMKAQNFNIQHRLKDNFRNIMLPQEYLLPDTYSTNTRSSNSNVNINQKTDIHVTGVSDPMLAARNVRNEQDAVNLQMTRNSKGVLV